jgi:glycosyltransferase A (GT-A) superfamily protein (DUF2064 family)
MINGFREAYTMGFKRVALIGSDIPDLRLEFIEEAFTSLKEKDAVIGPSLDGGYYLIGFKDKTSSSQVFKGIPWSTERVFEQTTKILEREGLTVHFLKPLRDIDKVEDLGNFLRGSSNSLTK